MPAGSVRRAVLLLAALTLAAHGGTAAPAAPKPQSFRAGAYAIDITPAKFPVVVNGMFLERTADKASDPIHARCLVLDDGSTRVAIVVVDSCMMPRELLDQAKLLAQERTGIPSGRMLVSATHTHSAPSAVGILGSDTDPEYARFLPGKIAEGIEQATRNLAPARVGWAVIDDYEHTHCRRWIYRPDKMLADPFGEQSVRANMHPGYQNPNAIAPSGPVDPGLTVLSLNSPNGRPIALLANYSMHYFGAQPVLADYYGLFAEKIKKMIGADGGEPPFVGIMSQGTSGDQMWMDYGKPKPDITLDAYAEGVTRAAYAAYQKVEYRDWVSLDMAETTLSLKRRTPDPQRLAWANEIVAKMAGQKPRNQPEVYAREQIYLHEQPVRELKLQAVRIGELGITAIPNEVFGITGLKIKAQSPFEATFNIELANGAEGYIPPPEQHKLGGYTTWPARSAGLETEAEPKIVEALLGLLEQVSGRSRRKVTDAHGPYARAVLASNPAAYWRFSEFAGPQALDASRHNCQGRYEDGVVFYIPGPQSPNFSGGQINRSAHFAGGRMRAAIPGLGNTYTVEMWFWNGLPNDVRTVTGYLFARGSESLGMGGGAGATGKLLVNETLGGNTGIPFETWNYVVLVRQGKNVAVYLNGNGTPEIAAEAATADPGDAEPVFIGGRYDKSVTFEGKIDEVAVYDRALTPAEVAAHYRASGL